jgi:metal-dependent amidase/aminoacylase/carboxypeptidase family protein
MITRCTLRALFRPSGRLARALAPALLTLQAAWLPAGAAQAQPQALAPAIDAQLARHYPALERLHQDLHAHPELGFQEVQAAAKLADGLCQRFGKPDGAFALHTWPMAHGEIAFNAGAVTLNAGAFELTFAGRGAHGSAPDKSIDPLLMASRFVVDVQGVVSREKDPFQFGVLSVGAIQGGTSGNIIPDSALLRGTLRSGDPTVRTKRRDGLRRTALATTTMAGAPEPKITITPGGDATIHDTLLVERAETVLKAAFGAQVRRMPPITPSEDFAELGSAGVPSMFFLVGVLDPKDVEAARQPGGKPVPGNHAPFFAPVPEPSIRTAVKAMSLAVLSALQR